MPLQDMLDAFPNEDRVNSGNMRQFATAVAGLLHISDFQRRRITHMMRHYRDMRRKYALLPCPATRPRCSDLPTLHLAMHVWASTAVHVSKSVPASCLALFCSCLVYVAANTTGDYACSPCSHGNPTVLLLSASPLEIPC